MGEDYSGGYKEGAFCRDGRARAVFATCDDVVSWSLHSLSNLTSLPIESRISRRPESSMLTSSITRHLHAPHLLLDFFPLAALLITCHERVGRGLVLRGEEDRAKFRYENTRLTRDRR